MQTLHIISHSHWDREWYQTFQQFRLRLVHMVDNLLTILDADPTYAHFMLDGQTIVLEDYLQMRMANFPLLQHHIRANRILIGPWYILPDEFLVSGEATIRNLLVGKQISELFGQRMMVGYLPDPFGHIGQMPQILNGFHIDTACLWRGVPDGAPTVFSWEAPDGSTVLMAHLYQGYGNLANWPLADAQQSLQELDHQTDLLAPYNPTDQFLMMRGSDHLEPRPELPAMLRYYNREHQDDRQAIHSTLPAYLAAVSAEIEEKGLILGKIKGELRDGHKAHLLPGVLSSRMWIKQRNHYAQTLLERWVEPFSTWAELALRGEEAFTPLKAVEKTGRIADPGALIHQTWKLLLSNHPHDSICGCSIDATHNDMITRFDQVEQVGKELTGQSLRALSSAVNTVPEQKLGQFAAITVFNAAAYPKTGLVEVDVDMPADAEGIQILNAGGKTIPCGFEWGQRVLQASEMVPFGELRSVLADPVSDGWNAQTLVNVQLVEEDGKAVIEADFSSVLPSNQEGMATGLISVMELVNQHQPANLVRVKRFNIQVAKVTFLAEDVPAFGYKTYWAAKDPSVSHPLEYFDPALDAHPQEIENEFFIVGVEGEGGTLRLHDQRNHGDYFGLNAIIDRGDRGDEYNFTPPESDRAITPTFQSVDVVKTELEQALLLQGELMLPEGLSPGRDSRSEATIRCPLVVVVSLAKGVPAVDVQVQFDNAARDHRLEVRFPTGLEVDSAYFDGQFDVVERRLDLPKADETWKELPRPETPQQAFTDVSTADGGLMIANQGLPEAAVLRDEAGRAVIALTLLRAVGWLSRDDLWNRQGHAGPPIETPDAQELSEYTFDYRIIPHALSWPNAAPLAYTFQTPFEAEVSPIHQGKLEPCAQITTVEPPEFFVSAIKEAENESGWIVRGVNLADHAIELTLKTALPAKSAALLNLDESLIETLKLEDGSVRLKVASRKIVTVLFRIQDGTLDR